jgi:alpha-glucosidase (family GH31 glycosyl hydrolase)
MRTHCTVAVAALWLLVGLAPAISRADAPPGTTAGAAIAGAAIAAGNARFEFLTPSLVRLEYSPSGKFVDAPTAVVQKRDWPEVRITAAREGAWLVASSGTVTVRYRSDSGVFTAANLAVTWSDLNGRAHTWRPGDIDTLNLGGLTYSLDNVSAANLPQGARELGSPVNDQIPGIDLELPRALPGLLSRSGYAFIDDSRTPLMNAARTWIEPRPRTDGQDWYLFVYVRDYSRVLGEYAQLSGPIPMIPRFVLGPWISDFNFQYFPDSPNVRQPAFQHYNQQYLVDEVSRMRGYHIPFATLVLDFAWHNYGWQGGYDWSPLIPHPLELMRSLNAQGVKLSLNDHPGYIHADESILSYSDSHAAEVLTALGRPLPVKPSFSLDLSGGWSFASDADDVGVNQRWYAPGEHRAHWRPIRTGLSWQEQGYDFTRGAGWYRRAVRLPANAPHPLYLYLGEVSGNYRIFVNGQEATHSYDHWPRRLTSTDLAPYVSGAAEIHIVLRVEPDERHSGILRGPVALRDVSPPELISFDLADEKQADVFMRYLHGPLMEQGVDVWWVDGGSGATQMAGLNSQLWTNKVFYDYSQQHTGKRAFILGRYGDWGSQRYPGFFTGDAYSEWPVLAYEVAFAVRGGNVLVPYISHDIGGFHGGKIDFDLYARWIEFGTFSAILRLHSAHENPREGNLRMPWVYGEKGIELARKYFTLRTQLIPYLYTYAWLAHRESLPLLRPLYLEHPDVEEAYRHPHEYFFGAQILVAPVLDASGRQSIWLPPGDWRDFFTGSHYEGDNTFSAHYAVDETPVFVREGAVIPEQSVGEYSDAKPGGPLILTVYGPGEGRFALYEDDGDSLDYDGRHALTTIVHATGADGTERLVIVPAIGTYPGQAQARAYELRLFTTRRPGAIAVNGRNVSAWTWDPQRELAVLKLADQSIRETLTVEWHP